MPDTTSSRSAGVADAPPATGRNGSSDDGSRRRRWGVRGVGPPGRTDHALPWLAVLLIVVLGAVPMLMALDEAEVVDAASAEAVGTSVQTWRDMAVVPRGGMKLLPPTPRYNGQPRFDDPPGLTWLHLLALSPLDRDEATVEDLIYATRLVSVAFGLLLIASVFWAGRSIGGIVTATMAGLVCASMPAVLTSGREATAAMQLAGMAVFAAAAALWAARPFKPHASLTRQAVGWTLCGLALGAAVLIGGAAMTLRILLPLIVVLLICPRRVGNLLALAAACCIAALMLAPWAVHVHEQSPTAWRSWFGPVLPSSWDGLGELGQAAACRLGWVLLGTLPWTLWLVGALVQPLSTSSTGARQRMFVGWGWFMTLALLLLVMPPSGSAQRLDLLLLLAVASLVTGQVFRQYSDLSDQGRHVRYWSTMRFPQLALLLTLSAALPMVLGYQDGLIRDGWMPRAVVAPMNAFYWIGLAVALTGIAGLSMRYALQHHPGRTLACWSVWTVTASAVIAIAATRGPLYQSQVNEEARALRQVVGDAAVAYVGAEAREPDPVLLLYSGLMISPRSAEQVEQIASEGEDFYVLTPIGESPKGSWQSIDTLPAARQRLWRSQGGKEQPVDESASVDKMEQTPEPAVASPDRGSHER